MPQENIIEEIDRLIEGKKIINPAYQNPELAEEISANFINEDREKRGIIQTDAEKLILEKTIYQYFGKQDLAEQILDIQPLYYDENRIWWYWDKSNFKWTITDETNILNFVRQLSFANTIKSKEKLEIIEALKQEARLRKLIDIKPTWIQFKNKIYDIDTGENFIATPEYFVTNPIPYEVSGNPSTPKIDKIFEEWVGKDYVKTLHQIIAYSLIPDYPIHRLFCFIGNGMNGKSCFLKLLKKFIGNYNCCSTELDILMKSRFEVTRLHKKLVCLMGETNFNEMSQTSIIKKLTGGDLIGFEYKNKTPFEDVNCAKIIIATNNLPTTTDKTIGFYRRWMIIDFPNHFSEKKEILLDIPEEEYSNLATNCVILLKELLQTRIFHNEGTIDERLQKYESKSNFLEKFISDFVIYELNGFITKSDFYKKFISWSKENRHRELSETSVGLQMKKLGYESGTKHFEWLHDGKGGMARIFLGIKWKE